MTHIGKALHSTFSQTRVALKTPTLEPGVDRNAKVGSKRVQKEQNTN